MLGRRFLLLVAVLMGLMALAASVAPRQPVVRERTESTPAPPSGAATLVTVKRELAADGGGSGRVVVREGDLVELTVSGSERDAVMVLGRIDSIHPASPARFSLLAGEPGQHPIELLGAERRIGTLVIRGR